MTEADLGMPGDWGWGRVRRIPEDSVLRPSSFGISAPKPSVLPSCLLTCEIRFIPAAMDMVA